MNTTCPHIEPTADTCECACRWCTTLETCVNPDTYYEELPQHRRALVKGFLNYAAGQTHGFVHFGVLHIQIEDGNLEFDFEPRGKWNSEDYTYDEMIFGTLWNALEACERLVVYEFFSAYDWGPRWGKE